MSLPRAALLLGLALILAAGLLLLLRTGSAPVAPPLEQPRALEGPRESRTQVQLEDSAARADAAEPPPAPAPAPEPPAELRAEGKLRGWQLPAGKAWWTDPLVNPDGRELAGAEIEALQALQKRWSQELLALRLLRERRLKSYAQDQVDAGLGVPDPHGNETLPEGKERVVVNTHTPEDAGRFWYVDVGTGDDAELDRLDLELGGLWCQAVLEMRASLAKPRR